MDSFRFSLGLALNAAMIAAWVYLEMYNCKQFEIDYSSAPTKSFIITGANSGLGLETARVLALNGGHVIMACRSLDRCNDAKQKILSETPNAKIDTHKLDLGSFSSIINFSNEIKSTYQSFDVLINNAGIMALPTRQVTEDGLEAQIGTNHFGHFLLTALLYPSLNQNGRIINHSSTAHFFAARDFVSKDLQSEKSYDPWTAYGNSKISNLYFTNELINRLETAGNPKNITVVAVHPGYTATNLQTDKLPYFEQLNNYFAMHVEDGAKSQLYGMFILIHLANSNF